MKKIIISLILFSCLVCPAFAGTISYEYVDCFGATTSRNTPSAAMTGGIDGLYFCDISAYSGLNAVVVGMDCTPFGTTPSWTSKEVSTTFTISGVSVGSGTVTITNIWNAGGSAVTGVILCIVPDTWDVMGRSGATSVKMVSSGDVSINTGVWGRPDNTLTGIVYPAASSSQGISLLSNGYAPYPYLVDTIWELTGYNNVDFSQTLTYDYDDPVINLQFDKNGYANNIEITGQDTGTIYFNSMDLDDINLDLYEVPLFVNVTNPYYALGSWSDVIPETSTPEDETDPAEFTAYIYDAQTGNLISWSYLNKTYSGIAPLPTTTYDPDGVIQDVVYWEDTDYAVFTAGATGYETTTTTYNYTALTAPAGSTDNVMSFQLVPSASIGNSSYALSFFVSQEISSNSEVYTRAVDASVNCDGEEHLTGPAGTTWFNVSAGDLEYTVSKNGFETVQGTVSVSGNTLETVYLSLGPEVPTISDEDEDTGDIDPEAMHENVAEAYAQFGAFIPEAVMIACVLFLLSMFKKF